MLQSLLGFVLLYQNFIPRCYNLIIPGQYDISYRHVIGEIKNISEDVDVQNVHIGYSFDRPPYATYINVTLKNIDADCENHIVACGRALAIKDEVKKIVDSTFFEGKKLPKEVNINTIRVSIADHICRKPDVAISKIYGYSMERSYDEATDEYIWTEYLFPDEDDLGVT